MKSTQQQLESRGFVSDDTIPVVANVAESDILKLLHSLVACERTLGAKLAGRFQYMALLPVACNLLETEKKLYTKLALADCIVSYGVAALDVLIPLLGKIGSNQHRVAAAIDLNKKSFPLPRDIVARIIIRLGVSALPRLEEIIRSGAYTQKLEAIDAIGHIAYTSNNLRSEKVLFALLNQYPQDNLILWKVTRSFQSYNSNEVQQFLAAIVEENTDSVLVAEAKRSIVRIKKRDKLPAPKAKKKTSSGH
jgi:hypothetical protein